jgi:cysteine desulfurase / selenocysteine lyase
MSSVSLEEEFCLDPAIVHLNHAGVGPWPHRTVEAICQFAQENMRFGSAHYMSWLETEHSLRELGARLINAPSADTIALLKNTSEALSLVAFGLDWNAGDEVLLPPMEFPSNRMTWEALQERFGIRLRIAEFPPGCDPEQELIRACTARTRLISVSSVNYATGLRLDLKRIGEHCKKNNILFCVDAIQSLGALPFDVQSCDADFVAADGHKWMLAPEGVALFYCAPRHLSTLRLNQFGWHMVEQMGAFDREDWQAAATARRFECGSPNNLGIQGLKASLELLQEVGMEAVSRNIHHNCRFLESALREMGCEILSAKEDKRRSGILCFRHPDLDSKLLYEHLMKSGILCALRGGGVRFSPHFYTPEQSMKVAVDRVKNAIDQGL